MPLIRTTKAKAMAINHEHFYACGGTTDGWWWLGNTPTAMKVASSHLRVIDISTKAHGGKDVG